MSRDWLLFPIDHEDPSSHSAYASQVIALSSNRALDDYLIALPFKSNPWHTFQCSNDQYFLDGWHQTAEEWLREIEMRVVTANDIVKMVESLDTDALRFIFPDNLKELEKFVAMPKDRKIVVVYY